MKLKGFDCEDVGVLAAALEGAVVKVGDMAFQPRRRRFVLLLNRFRWEADAAGTPGPAGGSRVRCGVRFDGVLTVRTRGFRITEPDTVLELLTIACQVTEPPAVALTLIFAGGFEAVLSAECVEITLEDIGQPWPTANRPEHDRASEAGGS